MSAKKLEVEQNVAANEEQSFELRLERLERISELMRSSDLGLEQAGVLFEEGIALSRALEKDLSRVERRIEILVNEPSVAGEKPVLELFPELENL